MAVQHEVLMVRRAKAPARGQWAFPGGAVEWAEPMRRAAQREVSEECSIDIEPLLPFFATDAIYANPHDNDGRGRGMSGGGGGGASDATARSKEYHFGLVHWLAVTPHHTLPSAATDASAVCWLRVHASHDGRRLPSPPRPQYTAPPSPDTMPLLEVDTVARSGELTPQVEHVLDALCARLAPCVGATAVPAYVAAPSSWRSLR